MPTLRPTTLTTFIGQQPLKARLTVITQAAKERHQLLPHLLLAGPPGLGKTTLAGILANEMGATRFRTTTGPALNGRKELTSILSDIAPGEILFLDEIHRIPESVGEVLYPVMEDFAIDIVIGSGRTARAARAQVGPFTLIGATTHMGLLGKPLLDRFGYIGHLEYYTPAELALLVMQTARTLNLTITDEAAMTIASRSRATARVANHLLQRAADYALVNGHGNHINNEVANQALTLFGIDSIGLDHLSQSILDALANRFNGRPVGLDTLSVALGVIPDTIESVEGYLLREHLIERTSRGREITSKGKVHINGK